MGNVRRRSGLRYTPLCHPRMLHSFVPTLLLTCCLLLLGACASKPTGTPARVASQMDCPDTMSDVDRTACMVSPGPEPLPDQNPPPALLKGSDGIILIGPKATP
jgi:hypothetical protein